MVDAYDAVRVLLDGDHHQEITITTDALDLPHTSNDYPLNFGDANHEFEIEGDRGGKTFTWVEWIRQYTNNELGNASSLKDLLRVVIYPFDSKKGYYCTSKSNTCKYKHSIDLNYDLMEQEFVVMHEFGHYVMQELQNGAFLDVGGAHSSVVNDDSPGMCITEGFADGFAMIMDEMTYNVLDQESGQGWMGNYHPRWRIDNNLNNPFVSEAVFACTMLDLWDGPNNYSKYSDHSINPYDDGGNDNFEVSFNRILSPLFLIRNTEARILTDINDYYNQLLEDNDSHCTYNQTYRDLWYYNFSNTSYNLNNFKLLNTDEVYDYNTLTLTKFELSGNIGTNPSNYNYTFTQMDKSILSGSSDSYNIRKYERQEYDLIGQLISDQIINSNGAIISDNLNVTNNAVLFVNGSSSPRYFNRNHASLVVYTNIVSDLNVNLCGNVRLVAGTQGKIEVGSVSPYQASNLSVNNGSLFEVNSNGTFVINNGSVLTIQSGATLLVKSGAIVNVKGTGKIIVQAGGFVCIENGAILNFDQNSELYVDISATIGVNPGLGITGSSCSNNLNACANLTGNNPNITAIPFLSFPVTADVNLHTGNSTVLRAGAAGLQFDGVDDYVSGNNSMAFPDQGTIAFWMNPSIVENYRNPFSTTDYNGGIRFEESTIAPYGFIALFGNETGFGGAWQRHVYLGVNEMLPNKWYHIIFTWDKRTGGPVVSGYLNGVKKFFEEPQDISNWPTTFPKISIGKGYDDSPNRHFIGMMDDIGIYSKYISTQADIIAAMQGSLSTNLLSYWDFSEGSGLSTSNSAGPVATLQNGTSWITSSTPITYTWTPTTGLSTNTGNMVVANSSTTTTYTVTATASGYCSSTSTIQVNVGPTFRLSSQTQTQTNNSSGSEISAYPNPASGNINVNVTGGSYRVEVLDLQGRILNEYPSADENLNINLSHLNNGLYILQIIQNGITSRKKLEILH